MNKISQRRIPSKEELEEIGELIYKNETGGNKNNLIHWGNSEDFASMGIGHFLWMPKDYTGIHVATFPNLIKKFKNAGLKLPNLLEENPQYCPWNNKQECDNIKNTDKGKELIEFLLSNKGIQVEYIWDNFNGVLQRILKVTKYPEVVEFQFNRISNSKNGLYPLIDYVNFKGEGLSDPSEYNHQGWGLRHVLEEMQGQEIGNLALREFSNCSTFILARRIRNSSADKKEEIYIKGWTARTITYRGSGTD